MIGGRAVRLVVVAIVLSGCASHVTPYPRGWPSFSSGREGCRSVAGVYSQRGERAPGGYRSYPRLASLATGSEAELVGPTAVLWFPEGDAFEIRVGLQTRRWRLDDAEAACRNGRLELRRHAYVGVEGFGPKWSWVTVSLVRRDDGWLLAEDESVVWQLVTFIVPIRVRSIDWYRYPPVKSR